MTHSAKLFGGWGAQSPIPNEEPQKSFSPCTDSDRLPGIMRLSRGQQALLFGLIGIEVILIGVFAFTLTQTWRTYRAFSADVAAQQQELAAAEAELARSDAYLRKLLEDPAFLEKVARERLGYAAPGELLFYFPETERK
jgi:cell division protein FtsB